MEGFAVEILGILAVDEGGAAIFLTDGEGFDGGGGAPTRERSANMYLAIAKE